MLDIVNMGDLKLNDELFSIVFISIFLQTASYKEIKLIINIIAKSA